MFLNKTILFVLILSVFLFAQGSLLLVGGGTDSPGSWADEPFAWFVAAADSGIIIDIDTEAGPGYASQFKSLGADGASETMIISTRNMANDSLIYKKLIAAKGIFMHGGDQWPYIETWKGTLVEEAMQYIFDNGGAIGGTSAGLAVLGEVAFDAMNGGLAPDQATYNPYDNDIHFTDDFLEILPDVLTDSHFHSRLRIGRLVPMLARRIQDSGNEDIVGIGVADASALTIDPQNISTAWGRGSVTILYKSADSFIDCRRNVPITFTNVNFDQLIPGSIYDLNNRQLVDTGPYLEEIGPFPSEKTYKDTTLNGSDDTVVNLGEIVIDGLTSSEYNAWNGRLKQSTGSSVIPHTVIIPRLYDGSTYDENRIMGGIWGCATNPHFSAIYLDEGCMAEVSSDGILTSQKMTIILDSWDATHTGINGTRSTNYSGIIGAKLHFLGPGRQYDLKSHQIVSALEEAQGKIPESFRLENNYPNPFNSKTKIGFSLPVPASVKLEIYDCNGKKVDLLCDRSMQPGIHEFTWDAGQNSSGVYFYRLSRDNRVLTKKCLYIK